MVPIRRGRASLPIRSRLTLLTSETERQRYLSRGNGSPAVLSFCSTERLFNRENIQRKDQWNIQRKEYSEGSLQPRSHS